MHEHLLEDDDGDIVDAIPLCSDWCHQMWCAENDEPYSGWYGCQESGQDQWCAQCGVRCDIDPAAKCDGTCLPVVVNLAYSRDRESFCEHGLPDSVAVNDV